MNFIFTILASPAGRALAATLAALFLLGAAVLGLIQYGKMQERHKNELAEERAKTASLERDIKAARDGEAEAEAARLEAAEAIRQQKGKLGDLLRELEIERARRSKVAGCPVNRDIGRRLRELRGD